MILKGDIFRSLKNNVSVSRFYYKYKNMKHIRNPDTYGFVEQYRKIKSNQYNLVFPKNIDKFSNGLYLQIASLPINLFIRGTEIL